MVQNKAPKVSIVIIFLNCEKFIQESIESVIAQTYSNWELILVDDGSTDNSTAIARKYANQFSDKIFYIDHPNHQNLGKSASRNLGSKRSNGKFLIFLDADDVLLPHKLERQVTIFEANPEIGMVYGPSLYWYGWTGKKEDLIKDKMDKIGIVPEKVYQPPHLITMYLTRKTFIPSPCGIMVRKDILGSNGGWENDFRHIFKNYFNYEDQIFLAKIVLNYPVYIEGISGDKYRQHHEMSTNKSTERQANSAHLIYLHWLSQYIVQIGLNDPDLNAELKKALLIKKIKLKIWGILPDNVISYLKIIKNDLNII